MFERTCGNCTACCKTHSVPEVQSSSGKLCRNCIFGKGCSVYDDRPFACQRYSCVWLQGKGGENDRPDRLKIVMDYLSISFNGIEVPIFNFWEVERGAIESPRTQQIMLANVEAGNIVVARIIREPSAYYFPKGIFSPDERESFILTAEGGDCTFD